MIINSVTNDNGVTISIGDRVKPQYKSATQEDWFGEEFTVKAIYASITICDGENCSVRFMAENDEGGSGINNLVLIKKHDEK